MGVGGTRALAHLFSHDFPGMFIDFLGNFPASHVMTLQLGYIGIYMASSVDFFNLTSSKRGGVSTKASRILGRTCDRQ